MKLFNLKKTLSQCTMHNYQCIMKKHKTNAVFKPALKCTGLQNLLAE